MWHIWQALQGLWFFVAMLLSGLAFLILGQHPILAIVLLGMIVIRIYTLQNKTLWWISLSCLCIGIVVFGLQRPNENKALPIAPQRIWLYADTIQVNGDFLSFESYHHIQGHHKVKTAGRYRLKSETEKNSFQNNWHNLTLEINGQLSRPKSATNPGEFDRRLYLWQQKKIQYELEVTQIKQIQYRPNSVLEVIHGWRQRLQLYFETYPKPLSSYLKGLIIGQFNDDPTLKKDLGTLGVIHLFSLSGLHVFIMVSLLFKIATRCLVTKETIEWFLLGLLPLYGLFVGSGTGIRRAVAMVCLTILLRKLGIQLNTLDRISLVLIMQLWGNAYTLFSLGGLLSYGLVFALIFNQRRGVVQQQVMLSLCSLPIILYFQYSWHLLTILLNLVMIPLFEFMIMPVVLISMWLPADLKVLHWLNEGLRLLDNLLHVLANIDSLAIIFGRPALWVVIVLVGLSFWLMNQSHFSKRGFGLYGILIGLSFFSLHNPIYGQVTLLDIGQGDSILITTPFRRKVILIDTGGHLNLPKQPWQQAIMPSTAEKVTVPYLKSQGIRRIDSIFITHQDADHLGDLTHILNQFQVTQIVYGAGLEKNPHFYDKVAAYPKIKQIGVLAGQQISVGPLNFKTVHPFEPGSGKNEDSLVLYSQIGKKRWLFTGDCYQDGEQQIMAHYPVQVDYIKLGHHGSKTSSNPDFLRQLSPEVALISSGRQNHYGHPSPETIATLQTLNIPFFNTQTNGMIQWRYSPLTKAYFKTYDEM